VVDIFVKSFNRPYYLDRCLFSIYEFIADSDFNIIILDDGTPKKYLNKIEKKYPEISIQKSTNYSKKSKFTSQGKEPKVTEIPIELWLNASKEATDYFLLLEDDMWFTKKIYLSNIVNKLHSKSIYLTKLMWLGNENLIQSKDSLKDENITLFTPNLPFRNPYLYKLIFNFDRFKFRKLFTLLNFYSYKRKLNYYSIYSVSGVIFKKEYFIQLWDNNTKNIDEDLQIINALKFLSRRNISLKFSRTNSELLKTGFISSSTNKKHFTNECDMFSFNFFLNEIWYGDNLDLKQNLPFDYSEKYIKQLLIDSKSVVTPNKWKKWSSEFKDSFRNFGCLIE